MPWLVDERGVMAHTVGVSPDPRHDADELAHADAGSRPSGKRLPAADRKHLILAGARRAFSKTGDVRGTTIKQIAEESGITEGIIYRHFESKEDLFVQCAVEPLTDQINRTLEGFGKIDPDVSGRDLNELSVTYWTDLITSLSELSPLLGLVLFGDPAYSVPFYRDVLLPGLERVNENWADAYRRLTNDEYPFRYATLGHFGMALMFAIHHRMADNPETIDAMAREITAMEAQRLGLVLRAMDRRAAEQGKHTAATPSPRASTSTRASRAGTKKRQAATTTRSSAARRRKAT